MPSINCELQGSVSRQGGRGIQGILACMQPASPRCKDTDTCEDDEAKNRDLLDDLLRVQDSAASNRPSLYRKGPVPRLHEVTRRSARLEKRRDVSPAAKKET